MYSYCIFIFIFQSQPPEQIGGVVTRRTSKVSQQSVSMDSGMRRMSIHEGVINFSNFSFVISFVISSVIFCLLLPFIVIFYNFLQFFCREVITKMKEMLTPTTLSRRQQVELIVSQPNKRWRHQHTTAVTNRNCCPEMPMHALM